MKGEALLAMDIHRYLRKFSFVETGESLNLFDETIRQTRLEYATHEGRQIPLYINEFWTSRQRQAASIHEISYRACYKPQLPRFFIDLFTRPGDVVYDPFSGRGTTIIEAGLMGRSVIANDVNPLSRILSRPRFFPPEMGELERRLAAIPLMQGAKADIDLSMFYHPDTEQEIVSLREYLIQKAADNTLDRLDDWIRMVATNRLAGHSKGFFSVYTLPPNQAVSPESQVKINERRNQKPDYRATAKIICKKTKSLLRNLSPQDRETLMEIGRSARFFTGDVRRTTEIPDEQVCLVVTSPPFLDVVQYARDNWLRCWFNGIDEKEVEAGITVPRDEAAWSEIMAGAFHEFMRILKPGGFVCFEVGEVKGGRLNMEDLVIPIGREAGFECLLVVINEQEFTKTSNIWGVDNNRKGTNTNRITVFQKPGG